MRIEHFECSAAARWSSIEGNRFELWPSTRTSAESTWANFTPYSIRCMSRAVAERVIDRWWVPFREFGVRSRWWRPGVQGPRRRLIVRGQVRSGLGLYSFVSVCAMVVGSFIVIVIIFFFFLHGLLDNKGRGFSLVVVLSLVLTISVMALIVSSIVVYYSTYD